MTAPNETPIPVLFTVTERFINIHIQGASICQFGITANNEVVLAFPNRWTLDQLKMIDGYIIQVPLAHLSAEMVFQEMDEDLAIPRYRRTRIAAPTAPVVHRIRSHGPSGNLARSDVEALVDAIVTSFLDEPHQTKSRTAQITKDLAARFDMGVMQIAGVRAALTRGSYGETLEQLLLAARRRADQRG